MTAPERHRLEHSKLYVEGNDDAHAIVHLLLKYSIIANFSKNNHDVAPNATEICPQGGKDKVLKVIKTAVQVSNGLSVGFVLDADNDPQAQWSAVRDRLRECELHPPEDMPADGYVDDVKQSKARVGVWLMPGQQRAGALEEFLTDLVPEGDPRRLLELATSSTEQARTNGATFPDAKRSKAVFHAWLAWQEEPGRPYGTAINGEFLRHDSPAARIFVAWYKRLFPDQS